MTKPSVTRIIAMALIGLLAAVVAGELLNASLRDTRDFGVKSAMALVSLSPRQSVFADVSFLDVTPEKTASGRVSIYAGVGTTQAKAKPEDSLISRSVSDSTQPTAASRQGVVLVVGGAAADKFAHCSPNVDAFVWPKVSYKSLSALEQAAVVVSITAQMNNRQASYGQLADATSLRPVDLAAGWEYTLIEPKVLVPDSWTMERASLGAPTSASQTTDSGSGTAFGNTTFFQCDVSYANMWTMQSWGPRWELPSLTVASAPSADATHTVSRVSVYRMKELPNFTWANSKGLESSTALENNSGLDGQQTVQSAISTQDPSASTPAISESYSSATAVTTKDVALFLTGVFMSLFASMVIGVLRLMLARRGQSVPTA